VAGLIVRLVSFCYFELLLEKSQGLMAARIVLSLILPYSRLSRQWKPEDRQQLPSVENRQASATHLWNLSTFICTIRTSQASRAVSYQRKTVRVSRVHKMFRPPRPAVAASAKATHDNHALLETTKPTRKRKQHCRCRQRQSTKEFEYHEQCRLHNETSREYYQPCRWRGIT
jgi:hypothetical protein